MKNNPKNKEFTEELYQKIKDTNSKENPFNIDNYNKSSIIDWHNIRGHRNIILWVSFKCNKCAKLDSKKIDNHIHHRFGLNSLLLGKSTDYITTHLIVMQIIIEKFNSCSIGICLNKNVENCMMKQIEMKNRIEMYERRK